MRVACLLLFSLATLSLQAQFGAQADLVNEIALIENGLTNYIQVKGERIEKYNLEDRMEEFSVPGVSIAVIKDGKLHWAKGYGIANAETDSVVNQRTLFQAGSISKPVAALAVIKLWEEGLVDLDTDVNEYLRKWKVPENSFTTTEKVTLRRLLTHSAGTTVHGFPGYAQTDTFPTDVAVLNGLGNTDSIYVDTVPGAFWRYSGGGYTIMENVVEDVTKKPFDTYVRRNVLEPLRMGYSTYSQPLPEKWHAIASAAYTGSGELYDGLWHNYPEQAAAGLWTNPTDLAYYCIEMQKAMRGESDFITKETAEAVMTKHLNDWGLGPGLTGEGDELIFRHGGKNAGFTNNMMAFANGGDGAIVMTSADRGGSIIQEVMRSISAHYGWGTNEQKVVELITLDKGQLQNYAGTYKYIEEVPGIGDYIMEISIEDGQIIVFDKPEDAKITFSPTSTTSLLDLSSGDSVTFEDESLNVFKWNDRFEFRRMD